jgi:hypothetical protein
VVNLNTVTFKKNKMAAIVGEERYVFETSWYDQQAEIVRFYRITFFPNDSSIEMVSSYLVYS